MLPFLGGGCAILGSFLALLHPLPLPPALPLWLEGGGVTWVLEGGATKGATSWLRPRPSTTATNGLRCQLLPTTFNISPTSSSAAFPFIDQRTLPKLREHSKYYFAPFALKGGICGRLTFNPSPPFLPNLLVNRSILHWCPLLFDGKSFSLAKRPSFAQSVFTFPETYAGNFPKPEKFRIDSKYNKTLFQPDAFSDVRMNIITKHCKNCECCPGHSLTVSH